MRAASPPETRLSSGWQRKLLNRPELSMTKMTISWPVTTVALLAMVLGGLAYEQSWFPSVQAAELTTQGAANAPGQLALQPGKPAVVEFGANACIACREMKPVLSGPAASHGDRITVLDVDVLKERQYLKAYQIRLMPTQVFFDAQGREVGRNMGKMSREDILKRLGMAGPK